MEVRTYFWHDRRSSFVSLALFMTEIVCHNNAALWRRGEDLSKMLEDQTSESKILQVVRISLYTDECGGRILQLTHIDLECTGECGAKHLCTLLREVDS